MALGAMEYKNTSVAGDVEILYNSAYVGQAITLDTTAFTSGVCKAGTPISADGKKGATTGSTGSETSTTVGILLMDVYEDRPQGTIVIGGFINTTVAQTHSGVTLTTQDKGNLKNVVFM
nr:MAG TPA: hypothetical protein [Caudoviricetes sp.]